MVTTGRDNWLFRIHDNEILVNLEYSVQCLVRSCPHYLFDPGHSSESSLMLLLLMRHVPEMPQGRDEGEQGATQTAGSKNHVMIT